MNGQRAVFQHYAAKLEAESQPRLKHIK